MMDGGGLMFAVTTNPSTSTRPVSSKAMRNEDTNRLTSKASLLKMRRFLSIPIRRGRPRRALPRLRHRLRRWNGDVLELELQPPRVFDLWNDEMEGVGTALKVD